MTGFVEIGSVGWEHSQWQKSYYPEELPSDWLFSYFSKQFRTVWLSAADLVSKSLDEVRSWLEDCDHFDFLLEIPDHSLIHKRGGGEGLQQWVQRAKLLSANRVGYVVRGPGNLSGLEAYLLDLSNALGGEFKDLFILAEQGIETIQRELSQLESVSKVVTPETVTQGENAKILIVDFQSSNDMRELGKTLHEFVSQNKLHSHLYCYFNGCPPSYSLMQSAQSIVTLLDS